MLAPPIIASQAADALPLTTSVSPARGRDVRRTKGERAKPASFRREPERRGHGRGGICPFKVRANGLLPGTRLSASLDGRGYSTSERGESSDDEGQSFRCSPEGPRSGDVGGAGLLTDIQTDLSTRSRKDAAMLRKKRSAPFALRKGREQTK